MWIGWDCNSAWKTWYVAGADWNWTQLFRQRLRMVNRLDLIPASAGVMGWCRIMVTIRRGRDGGWYYACRDHEGELRYSIRGPFLNRKLAEQDAIARKETLEYNRLYDTIPLETVN